MGVSRPVKKGFKKSVAAAMMLAIGIILPFFTGQIKEIGDTLLPMHLSVLLCGLICGWQYGLSVGMLLPLLRSAMFGMPPLFPNAVWMMAELAVYGLVSGILYRLLGKKTGGIYFCIIISMLCGRATWCVAKAVLLGTSGKAFTFSAFIAGGVTDALPGIILQLILAPLIMIKLDKGLSHILEK